MENFSMNRFALATLAIASLALPAAADSVKTDHDSHVNLAQLHSYCWGQVNSADPFYVSRIRDRVDYDLKARGWQQVSSGCDATVFATADVHNQQQVDTYYNNLGWGGRFRGGGGYGTATSTTVNQPIGTLVVDIFTTNDKQLAWRGSAQHDLSNKSQKNVDAMNKDIDKMLKAFPPKA
jgi:hypothetical protein